MDTHTDSRYWLHYIETMRHVSGPIKLDTILEKRMQAFISARQHKLRVAQE
jgi:hypothetical protein